jgi:hypothetical protein
MPPNFEGGGPLPRGKAIEDAAGIVLVPLVPNVCREIDRCERTLKRWLKDPNLGFPPVRRIRNRLYVTRAELEQWKRDVLLTAIDRRAGLASKAANAAQAAA